MRGTVKLLPSERDQNFHVSADDGSEFVLKISNDREDHGTTDFQTRAIIHAAAQDAELPLP